jgi:prevent-host-death family protein
MERTIGSADAGRRLSAVLDEVAANGDRFIVEHRGVPVAALVPIHLYVQWRQVREEFFDRLEATARRAGMSEEEGMALADEAVQAVRLEQRTREDAGRSR